MNSAVPEKFMDAWKRVSVVSAPRMYEWDNMAVSKQLPS